jgi:hypothetical protein
MAQKEEAKRDYTFSDGTLIQLTDRTITFGTRDSAELGPQGVTAARLNSLGALNTNFLNMPDDEELEGLVSEKNELKKAAYDVCETGTRNIRRMAENIFGPKSATYKRFGFEGINDLKEKDRLKAWYRIFRRATDNAAALAPEGLTAVVLAAYGTACDAANAAFDAEEDAIADRDNGTEDRIEAGNVIYAEVVKICNTGKDYWFDKSESKYNDYVITPSGAPVVQNIDLSSGQVINIKQEITAASHVNGIKVKNTSPATANGPIYIYLANSAGQGWTGTGYSLNAGEEVTLDMAQLGSLQAFLNAYNSSGGAGSIRVTGA